MSPRVIRALVCALILTLASPVLIFAQSNVAQSNATPSRITQAPDEANLTILHGNTHPLAQARFDQGAAPDSLPLQRMLLVLKRSSTQESALEALLDQQQDSTSPNFHQWLTPQQFGQQFGPSDQDIQTITTWLQSQGFQVAGVSNGRTVIEFSGTAGQVRQAFHTEIHRFNVNGQDHFANSADPQIPAALAPVVAGINTLYNFPRQPMHHLVGALTRSASTGQYQPVTPLNPLFNLNGTCGVSGSGCHWLGPYDFATIYNLLPLWNGGSSSDGTGQTIAIVGESDISLQDLQTFRSYFDLPSNQVNVIIDGQDPGIVPGDETESTLDVEWSGAVAKGAIIDFVISQSTEASLGVDLSAQYIVDNNLAPVLSESYGICELFVGNAGNQFYDQLWQQASAQGITVLVSTGDSGSAGCDRNAGTTGAAQFGLSVNAISSTPYNVAVGGTDFFDLTDFPTYWTANQPPTTGAIATLSALSYIPETTWNSTCTNAVFGNLLGFSSSAETNCNNPQLEQDGLDMAVGGSGGMSNCSTSNGNTTSKCEDGYQKPSWQSALTPADGARDLPDVSLYAAAGSPSGSAYAICEADLIQSGTSCDSADSQTQISGIGGTSASAPSFAGIMALVNQATGSRQGNANYILYKLAAAGGASCNSTGTLNSSCVFYDVTNGTIAMACAQGSADEPGPDPSACPIEFAGDTVGVLSGYSTTEGYDLATGLGSVNAANLISKWASFNSNLKSSAVTLTLNNGNPVNITHGQSVPISVTVTGTGGTPTGTVSLIANTGTGAQQGIASAPLVNGSATFSTTSLPGGTNYSVFAQYTGDGTFKSSSSATQQVTVGAEAAKITIAYELFDVNDNETSPNATTAVFGTNSLLRVNVTSQAGDACALNSPENNGCPTGTLTITDNGVALDGGSFGLNAQGYAEDQSIFLTGGQHTITANYTGDSSYSAAPPSTDYLSITKATSFTSVISNLLFVPIGTNATLTGYVNTSLTVPNLSYAPTGTVQFLNVYDPSGTNPPVSGQVTYTPSTDSAGHAELIATLLSKSLPNGSSCIYTEYSGDANYSSSSTNSCATVDVVIPTTMTVTPSSPSVQVGASLTLVAQVTPTQAGTTTLSGAVTFSLVGSGALLADAQISNGQAQVTISNLPVGTDQIVATYSGDNYYEKSLLTISETVTPAPTPAFNVTANPATLTISAPGQSASTTLTFTSQDDLTGSGTLYYSNCGIPSSEEITCTLAAFTLPPNGTAQATLTFSSTAASASAPTSPNNPFAPVQNAPRMLLFAMLCVLAALALTSQNRKDRRWNLIFSTLVFAVLITGISCGGGGNSSSGGGGGTQSNPGTPVGAVQPLTVSITVNGVAQTVPNLTVTVQ